MLTRFFRELPTQRWRLALVVVLLLTEALLNTVSITMLVPLGQALLDESGEMAIAGVSLDWLSEAMRSDARRISWLLVLMGSLLLIKVAAGLGKALLAARISREVWRHWVTELTARYLAQPYREIAREDSGVMLNLVAREAKRASNLVVIYLEWLASALTFVFLVTAMLVVEWRVVAAGAAGTGALYLLAIRPLLSRSRAIGAQSVEANQALTSVVSQTIQGVKDVTLLNLQLSRRRRTQAAAETAAQLALRFAVLQALPRYGIELLFALGILAMAAFVTTSGAAGRSEWLPLAFFFIAGSFRLATHGSNLTSNRIKTVNRFPSFEELSRRVSHVSPRLDRDGALSLDRLDAPIRVRNLRFAYEPDKAVLRGIDVDIPHDQLTFLTGPSGCGKSTFIDLLARLYAADEGSIEVAGHGHDEYRLSDWRRMLAYVCQTPVLFSGSIRDNLSAGLEGVNDAALTEAMSLAGATRFVESLPDGIDSPLGERGQGISGGQACRLAIARALMRRPALLILDESTTGIEARLEREILQRLQAIPNLGVLVVSHRRANIDLADVVLEMSNGRLEPSIQGKNFL